VREPYRDRQNVEQLFAWWDQGKIRPRIGSIWPLERAAEAIAWLADRRAIGKAVVEIGPPA